MRINYPNFIQQKAQFRIPRQIIDCFFKKIDSPIRSLGLCAAITQFFFKQIVCRAVWRLRTIFKCSLYACSCLQSVCSSRIINLEINPECKRPLHSEALSNFSVLLCIHTCCWVNYARSISMMGFIMVTRTHSLLYRGPVRFQTS